MKEMIDHVYPIGRTIICDHNPQDDYPWQIWTQDFKDRFPLGAGDTYAAGSTGGEAQHTLTVDEMPSHTHEERLGDMSAQQITNSLRRRVNNSVNRGVYIESTYQENLGEPITTASTGGSNPHNNMPPYKAARMWTRTA